MNCPSEKNEQLKMKITDIINKELKKHYITSNTNTYKLKHTKYMQISINVNENLLSDFGVIYIQEFLQRQLELQELQISANRVTKYLKSSKNVNWENEFETASQEA